MKKIFILTLAIGFCFISTLAFSAPFIVSDPVDPATCGGADQPNCPVSYTLYEQTRQPDGTYGDQVAIATGQAVEPDMSIRFDAQGRPAGNHRYTAVYLDSVGGVSVLSNPTQLGPLEPQGLKLTP